MPERPGIRAYAVDIRLLLTRDQMRDTRALRGVPRSPAAARVPVAAALSRLMPGRGSSMLPPATQTRLRRV